ncbi:MAG: FGGY family carbohydrate kinase, partial [Anaerolineae bacterium]
MGVDKYTIGVDYGTESGRAVLVNVATGEEVASAVHPYGDGVIDTHLPGSDTPLPPDFALQNPQDYITVLQETIPTVLRKSGVASEDIIGIGTDFTACTMLPIDATGAPLCTLPEWRENPYAWVKIWKHHAAQPEANELNKFARQRGETWLDLYGGKISSEWLIPKIWETLNKAPAVYAAADHYIEAADWIVLQLTGEEKRNACTAGYKALWHKRNGYPSDDFFAACVGPHGISNALNDREASFNRARAVTALYRRPTPTSDR